MQLAPARRQDRGGLAGRFRGVPSQERNCRLLIAAAMMRRTGTATSVLAENSSPPGKGVIAMTSSIDRDTKNRAIAAAASNMHVSPSRLRTGGAMRSVPRLRPMFSRL
jgi:hypothetical protein